MAKTARKTAAASEAFFNTDTEWEAQLPMTAAQLEVVNGMETVSDRIRYLTAEGYTRGNIIKMIPNAHGKQLLYQHVRNVLVGPKPKAEAK